VKVSLHNGAVNAYGYAMARDAAATDEGTNKGTTEGSRKRKTLTLTDPRAIRAIAHGARQQVIDELYSGSVLTATEAAKICGLSPSAMSYHLRALEKWGIVVRDAPSGDGRERPWRAGANDLSVGRVDSTSRASVRQAANTVLSTLMAGLNKAVDSFMDQAPEAKGAQLSHGRLYLTDEEADALNHDLDELVRRYDKGRTARNRPVDASPRDQYWLLLPHTTGQGG
jgi:predicted ArsR family transcriptional regulator